jgi:hypothetical protein
MALPQLALGVADATGDPPLAEHAVTASARPAAMIAGPAWRRSARSAELW